MPDYRSLTESELNKQIAHIQKKQAAGGPVAGWVVQRLGRLLRERGRRDMVVQITARMDEMPAGSLHKATGTPKGQPISKAALIKLVKATNNSKLRARAAICLARHHGYKV